MAFLFWIIEICLIEKVAEVALFYLFTLYKCTGLITNGNWILISFVS